MSYINKSNPTYGVMGLHCIVSLFRAVKKNWFVLVLTCVTSVVVFHHLLTISDMKWSHMLSSGDEPETISGTDFGEEKAEGEVGAVEDTKTSETVFDIDHRVPMFKLVSKTEEKPSIESDRAYGKILDELHLQETCQQDPSTVVIDVGAGLGKRILK